jgi:cytoskeletal protein CcmA (bactofilin family)
MKIRDKMQSGKLDTYIGEQTSFEGSLTTRDNLTIYGNVRGTIKCQGRVIIGESGTVEADILANDVVVSGKVAGNVTARGRLQVTSAGAVKGDDIKASQWDIQGKIEGHYETLSDGKPAVAEKIRVADAPPALISQEKPKLPSASISDQ